MKRLVFIGILFLGLAEFGYGAWIPAKAWLSQVLLTHAWQETLENGQSNKPWPWADTWPVLRFTHEPSSTNLLVLQGDSGQALAFGPGLTSQSPMPGSTGNTIISAHRDTHFGFLQQAKAGDMIELQDRQGNHYQYQLIAMDIVDSKTTQLQIDTPDDRVTLVTCYPFNQITTGGSLRYVVTGEKVSERITNKT
ncbi:MAG: class GN sortase [Gammaproteobacteria bacterium]|nr:class GN sortase [Gammaproteobacteria bacterium]